MGGNAINTSVKIYKQDIPLINKQISKFLNGFDYKFIGSYGRKDVINDIDILIASDIDTIRELCHKNNLHYIYSHGFEIASIEFPFNDTFIQIDLMLTNNMKWSEWIYHYPTNSNYTGKQRNQLLMATIVERSKKIINDNCYTQMSVLLNKGIYHTTKRGNKVVKREFFTNDPNVICNLVNLDIKDTYSYESIYELIKNERNILLKYEQYNRNANT